MKRLLLLALLVAAPLSSALAQMLCSRPSEPSCVRWLGSSASRDDFDHCRRQLVNFQEEVRAYIDCQRQDREQLIRDLDDAIRRFNNCASDRYC